MTGCSKSKSELLIFVFFFFAFLLNQTLGLALLAFVPQNVSSDGKGSLLMGVFGHQLLDRVAFMAAYSLT